VQQSHKRIFLVDAGRMDAPPWVILDPSERAMNQQIRVFALENGAATH